MTLPPEVSNPDPQRGVSNPSPSDWPLRQAGGPRFRLQDLLVRIFLMICVTITLLTTVGLIVVLGVQAFQFFRDSGLGLFQVFQGTEIDFSEEVPEFSLLPLLWGTLVVAVGSSLIALPLGLLSAIYLSEYAPRPVRAILKPTLELLAGIPSIVYGYLGVLLITPILQVVFGDWMGLTVPTFNAASACIVVGIMSVPMVSSLSEDIFSAVPRSLREAGYALGATKFEVSTQIVLPAGFSGVVASFILAISRAIGETMAVVLTMGSVSQITLNPFAPMEAMTVYIVNVVGGEAAYGSPEYLSLFVVGITLFLFTLVMNIISRVVLNRYREVYQ